MLSSVSDDLKIRSTLELPGSELSRIYSDIDRLIEELPDCSPNVTIDKFVESDRVLPQGTPYPGPWKNKRAPHSVEPMQMLSPSSPVQEIYWLKAVQMGVTAVAENAIGYYIKLAPGPILYTSANEKMLAKWNNKRLNPMLISCGIENKIQAQHQLKGSRRTGNTLMSKEFPGGSLDLATGNSEAGLRSDSIQYLFLDEVDTYPQDIQGLGDPIKIAKARTDNFSSRKKIFAFSTPSSYELSHIWKLFIRGDQRKFEVPCPHCKEFQFLEWGIGENGKGIVWDVDEDGVVVEDTVGYVCEHCGCLIKEEHKFKMMNLGKWKATAKAISPYVVSYHINKLYSLMTPWIDSVNLWLTVKDDPQELQAFINLVLGMPYKEMAYKPQVKAVKKLRGLRKRGTIPEGVLYLTAGLDVQEGFADPDKNKPPRLEMEILGHGLGYRTWSIDYKIFEGETRRASEGAWLKLREWIKESGMTYYNKYGRPFGVNITFMDSGNNPSVTYQEANMYYNTYAIKGAKASDVGLDENRPDTYRRYRRTKIGTATYLYLIHTVAYKDDLYRNLSIERRHGARVQSSGFCDFPSDYPDEYFEQLVAEERREDGSFWHPKGRPNEALDCRVYAACAGHVFLDSEVEAQRKLVMAQGHSRETAEKTVGHLEVLKAMEKNIAAHKRRALQAKKAS